jgi:hypothetical protein
LYSPGNLAGVSWWIVPQWIVAVAALVPHEVLPMNSPDTHCNDRTAVRCARLALDGIRREYPNQMALVLTSDADARPPRASTPAFCGCYDWHSAVHAHWSLVRLARLFPEAGWADDARAALATSLTAANLSAEVQYLKGPGREGFERPYGLAWLLQLAAELREWGDRDALVWRQHLLPLEQLAVDRLSAWLPKLTHPIRSGEHSQTAFAMGLALDWARTAENSQFETLLKERARGFHQNDRRAPLAYEPSGHDFLSPCLAEADLMRRVLEPDDFAAWLEGFLPDLPLDASTPWMHPVMPADTSDGKLAHLDGLSLSRAWMLDGILGSLPNGDPRIPALSAAAAAHREAGLRAISNDSYSLTHWIASFAVYLLTRRGTPGA